MDLRLISALHERSQVNDDRSQPTVFDLAVERDATRLRQLLDSGAVRWVHDTIDEQLGELLAAREPARIWSRADLDEAVRAHLAGRQAVEYGRWVHYPWSARLVHVLPPNEFRELRTDRNRYKITRVEQDRLGQLHIGVVGLSVGNAAALTLALEGIGGSFKLADFDRLGLSNLNRIRAGIDQLGLPKTALTARQIAEINPYLDIELFPAGARADNIEEFLTGGRPLDLLIEESDSLAEIVSDGSTPPNALAAFITERVTNRRRDGAGVLSPSQSEALIAAANQAGAALQLLTGQDELAEIGALIGSIDRISLLNRGLHREATSAYRWTPQEVRDSPHGIDVATLELTPTERAGLRLLQQWRVTETLGKVGGGGALEDLSRTLAASASAVGLITVPGVGRESYFRGGRAMQRVWLTATALGLGFQPMTLLVYLYLFARLERGGGAGLTEPERAELRQLRARFRGLLNTHPAPAEVLLFRLTHAGPPSARSLRRPLDETLRIG